MIDEMTVIQEKGIRTTLKKGCVGSEEKLRKYFAANVFEGKSKVLLHHQLL